jgi:hypothetical protein
MAREHTTAGTATATMCINLLFFRANHSLERGANDKALLGSQTLLHHRGRQSCPSFAPSQLCYGDWRFEETVDVCQ